MPEPDAGTSSGTSGTGGRPPEVSRRATAAAPSSRVIPTSAHDSPPGVM
ncbi:hypothetical protein [Nonomuraea bangladeshensis]